MRSFVAGIVTETNTLSPMPTGLADFVPTRPTDPAPKDGSLEAFELAAAAAGDTLIRGTSSSAMPGGVTVRSAYETMRTRLLEELEAAMPVDAVFLPLHGAMVAEGYDDAEGDVISTCGSGSVRT
jgi:Uncharacterized conserved protein